MTVPRFYHQSASLIPDGRVMVAGSTGGRFVADPLDRKPGGGTQNELLTRVGKRPFRQLACDRTTAARVKQAVMSAAINDSRTIPIRRQSQFDSHPPTPLSRLLPVFFDGHRHLALENLALRQQLSVYKKTLRRPKLHPSDQLFGVCLSRVWAEWRQAS
jgi:hypothetical protein